MKQKRPSTPDKVKRKMPKRFWSKIIFGNISDCWEWTASTNVDGYGNFGSYRNDGKKKFKTVIAHRFLYRKLFGELSDGMCVLHKCDNPKCCNPNHFWIGTRVDNNRDRHMKGRSGSAKGSHNARAKLTEEDIPVIRNRISKGEYQYIIADEYGIDKTVISDINVGKIWKHVK